MIMSSIIGILFGLAATLVCAKFLYKYSVRNNSLDNKKSNIINGVILAFTFFCSSCLVYVVLVNMI